MLPTRIVNARIATQDGSLADAELGMCDGRIAPPSADAQIWDARGMLLLPGIVDIHGDAFERQMMPRPGVYFADDLALLETDRQLVANGITTAFHALTWSWEPGLRSTQRARGFVDGLERMRPHLACDTKLHLRWETFNLDALDEALSWIADGRVALFAFNDHTTGMLKASRGPAHAAKIVERTGLRADEFAALLDRIASGAADVAAANKRLASAAVAAGIAIASHDDRSPEDRAHFQALGCAISEFPLTRETAAAARDSGGHVVMGAPNVVRGGSHLSLVAAETLVRADLCDILASDYYYPAMLQAAWRLGGSAEGLAAFWPLVSANPARAAGLADRGTLALGMRADCIVVDVSGSMPRVAATFVEGRRVYEAAQLGQRAA
jgi:alpha-D-ribose 1-methylphosphonate 5-triphosphate diphosphatase